MRRTNAIFIILIGLVTSCYQVYDPHIDTSEKVLVVNGKITNKTDAYHILLTYAKTINSSGTGVPVSSAEVYVTDDLDNSYIFHERGIGDYISDSLQFTGIPGRTYRLHITTPDGAEYESDPQQLIPEAFPDSVYAEFGYQETLSQVSGKVLTHGANILADIRNQSDSLPRYRLTSNLVRQYFYMICPFRQSCILFYCWQTVDANSDIDLTNPEYSTGSASIRKQIVCFLDDNPDCYALYYTYRDWPYNVVVTAYHQTYAIHHRILYLNLYSLNNESYQYYKSLDEQMKSEGKLFDPIAAQLNGNINCISDPGKKAIGLFEASSVNNSAYIVDFRNLKNSQPDLIKTPYILPPETNGARINSAPLFWILI
jgi:hypothetical protein